MSLLPFLKVWSKGKSFICTRILFGTLQDELFLLKLWNTVICNLKDY